MSARYLSPNQTMRAYPRYYSDFQGSSTKQEDAIDTFPSIESFVGRHKKATIDEWKTEEDIIHNFNDAKVVFPAHIMKVPTTRGASNDYYVFRVDVGKHSDFFPAVGQECKIRLVSSLEETDEVSVWHPAESSLGTFALRDKWAPFFELRVASFSSPDWDIDEEIAEISGATS